MTTKLDFTTIWDQDLGPLKMMQATSTVDCLTLLGVDGRLHLIDGEGKACCTSDLGKDIRTISLADTRETLAVTDAGFAVLVDPEGRTLFKKRIVPALYGMISASGQWLAFVTRDPLVTLTDRTGRARWSYRKLEKVPPALDLSHDGETTAFSCLDDRGEGLAAIARDGTPYDSFMGLDPLQDLTISGNGQVVVALDRGRGILCINCVNGFGVWKGQLNNAFNGLTYADQIGQTLLYSRDGLLLLLNDKGETAWEHRFPFPLLRAKISADGQTIAWASPAGRIGCLRARSADAGMRPVEFLEVPSEGAEGDPPLLAATSLGIPAAAELGTAESTGVKQTFHRLWESELESPAAGDRARFLRWLPAEGSEYLLLWNGRDSLSMLNDSGEEIWRQRLVGGALCGLGASGKGDLVLALAKQGIMGIRFDGGEAFRIFGEFKAGHPFLNGAFLLVNELGVVRFYRNANHFSHVLELNEPAQAIVGWGDGAWVIGRTGILLVDAAGVVQGGHRLSAEISCWAGNAGGGHLIVGGVSGELVRIDQAGATHAWMPLPGPILLAGYHEIQDAAFAAVQGESGLNIIWEQGRSTVPLKGEPRLLEAHPRGAIVGTSIDELLLIDPNGGVSARYTYPDRLLGLSPARNEGLFALAEGTLSHFSIGSDSPTAPAAGARFLEL